MSTTGNQLTLPIDDTARQPVRIIRRHGRVYTLQLLDDQGNDMKTTDRRGVTTPKKRITRRTDWWVCRGFETGRIE